MASSKRSLRDKIAAGTEFIESPWLVGQTKSHPILGFFARHIDIAPILALAYCIYFLVVIFSYKGTVIVVKVICESIPLLILIYFSIFPRLRQAIVFWVVSKFTIGVICVMFIFVGFPILLIQGHWDARLILALGLVWLPSLEFIRGIKKHQKWITLARLIVSIPLVYLGYISGNWHW